MKNYLKHQLSKINKDTPADKQVYTLNTIYAYLESRGHKRRDIKLVIDEIILGKILIKKKKLEQIEKKLKGV